MKFCFGFGFGFGLNKKSRVSVLLSVFIGTKIKCGIALAGEAGGGGGLWYDKQLFGIFHIPNNYHVDNFNKLTQMAVLNNHISKYNSFILVLYRRYINYVSVCRPAPPPPPLPPFLAPSYATE